MVAIVIIAAVVSSQASLLILGAQAQSRISTQRLASSILQSEMEGYQVVAWDDIMMETTAPGSPALCDLGGEGFRSSAQMVRGESTKRTDNVTFTITRNVVWTATQEPVACDVLPNDRGDTKTLTITVSWSAREGAAVVERERTGSIILTRHRINQKEIIL
jgi:hypothetical protein